MMILGFDPGRDKCGVAVVGDRQQIYYHEVISAENAIKVLKNLAEKFSVNLLIMGNQTTSKAWKVQLEKAFSSSLTIVLVDERNSSLEARDRYWEMYPPQGIQKLIPQGMRVPPRPIDDIVAILLIERYLK
jgi:RNase H-fold protein (predicted Holliday junction resolvase)